MTVREAGSTPMLTITSVLNEFWMAQWIATARHSTKRVMRQYAVREWWLR